MSLACSDLVEQLWKLLLCVSESPALSPMSCIWPPRRLVRNFNFFFKSDNNHSLFSSFTCDPKHIEFMCDLQHKNLLPFV